MEKCTFCIQRIKDAKDVAKNEGRALRDGEFQVACEEGCSTGAIVFGDMNDKESRVSKAFADARTYSLLEEYNAVPSVRYMTKIRNAKREDEQHGGDH
jgi:molybdopterin-containing oxidoreductase family iron-sulfur binding subunit